MKNKLKYLIIGIASLFLGTALPALALNITVPSAPVGNYGNTLISTTTGAYVVASTTEVHADTFPGIDMNDKINNAYALGLSSFGGKVLVPCGTFTSATPLNFSTSNKPVMLIGCGSNATTLIITSQSTTTTYRTGQQGDATSGFEDITISGTSTTDIAPCIELGGGGGSFAYGQFKDAHVTKCGIAWYVGQNSYIINWSHVISDFNANSFVDGVGTNQNEALTFTDGTLFSDGRNSVAHPYDNCISVVPKPSQGAPSFELIGIEHDKCQIAIGAEVNTDIIATHGEIVANSNPAYVPIAISGDANTTVNQVGGHELNGNDAAHSPACTYTLDGNASLTIEGTAFSSYGGFVIPTLVCNTGTGNRTYLAPQNIASTGWTTLETSTETPGTDKVGYFLGNHLGLGTTTNAGLLNLDGIFPQVVSANGGTGGGIIYTGVTNSGNGAGGNRYIWSPSNSTTAAQLTWDLTSTKNAFGIGTTSPRAKFAVQGDANEVNSLLFDIASTTSGGAVSDLFTISNIGTITTNLATGCLTSTGGVLSSTGSSCVTGSVPANEFLPFSGWGSPVNATSTLIGFTGGLFATASSTFTSTLALNGAVTATNNFVLSGNAGAGVTQGDMFYDPTNKVIHFGRQSSTGGDNTASLDFRNRTGGYYINASITNGSVQLGAGGNPQLNVFLNNVGVGTTSTTFAKLGVQLAATDVFSTAFAIGSSTSNSTTTLLSIDNVGHFNYKAASSTCGAGCNNIVGDDDGGTVTTGTTVSTVTVNFGAAWKSTPVCTVTDSSTAVTSDISAISTTAFTVSFSIGLTGTIYYQCANYQ